MIGAALLAAAVTLGASTQWTLQGSTVVAQGPLPAVVDATWCIAGHADFDNNNVEDLVWFNTSTQQIGIWYMAVVGNVLQIVRAELITGATLAVPPTGTHWEVNVLTKPSPRLVWRLVADAP